MSKDKRVLGKVGMALLLVFFYAPILFMIIFSFNSSKSLTHFTGFSLCWYEAMLKNHGMMESLVCHNYYCLIGDNYFYDHWYDYGDWFIKVKESIACFCQSGQ